jgi:hypothetical protein
MVRFLSSPVTRLRVTAFVQSQFLAAGQFLHQIEFSVDGSARGGSVAGWVGHDASKEDRAGLALWDHAEEQMVDDRLERAWGSHHCHRGDADAVCRAIRRGFCGCDQRW